MAKKTKDIGFGYKSAENVRGIINKNGTTNILHLNRPLSIDDLYTYFIGLSWWKFFIMVVFGYTLMNVFFGIIYVIIGIEQITPSKGNLIQDFLNGFFFSAQTLTTVGYGGIAPKGITANIIAAFQALIGLMSFSFITGLLYGRFSKPKAAIRFSHNLILRDFNGGRALMLRLMNSRKTLMIEPEVSVTLSMNQEDETGQYKRSFYVLELERKKITYLPTMWTIVHRIDEKSPLFKLSNEEIKKLNAGLYILVQYHEESFGQKVYQTSSYKFTQVVTDVKYTPSSTIDEDGYTVLDHEKLSEVEPL
ncbi:ion transporter [Tenacibaculum sp. SZ-18]|uniref:ion channel n=1 Tax=Tenacibaculum sp. SZ-18 TaxID=754423 RepID=UPI000C2D0CD9|nr:ion channel [Tenacibaculum sp. SZ-18]AUC16171.1 ion transporter [Tenacibaculum sp. SZ-18]